MNTKNREFLFLICGLLIGVGFTAVMNPELIDGLPTTELAMGSDRAASHRHEFDSSTALPEAKLAVATSQRVAVNEGKRDELEGFVDILPMRIPTEAELERRYRDMDVKELIGAEKSLNYVVHTEAKAFLKKKLERGIYTTHVVANGTPMDQSGTYPDGAPRSTMIQYHSLGDGLQEVRLAEIHPSEQPILEARHTEIAWVSKRVQALSKKP